MAEEHEKKEERDDADAGTLLKTLIDRLDSLHKRMDAMEEKDDSEEEEEKEPEPVAADKRKRKDASEEEEEEKEERKDAKEKDEDDSTVFYRGNKAPKKDAKKDSRSDEEEKEEREDDDAKKARRDDDDDSRRKDARRKRDDDDEMTDDDDSRRKDARKMKRDDKEEEKEEREDDNDARRDRADSSISRRIAKVESMLNRSDSDRAAFSDVQARADDVYHAFGKSAPAPMSGETLMAYRQRMVIKLKEHSPTWKDVNIYAIADDKGFEAVERTVYADALGVAHSPATVEPGTLRSITTHRGGHEFTTYEGEPRAWMDSMAGPVRMHVTSINTPNGSQR